jgi:hypothetical protein
MHSLLGMQSRDKLSINIAVRGEPLTLGKVELILSHKQWLNKVMLGHNHATYKLIVGSLLRHVRTLVSIFQTF